MSDQQKWRDRIEFSLDNRQVFLLFFSSAVVISLVFASGVVVGKRLKQGAADSIPSDPLALLDQMGGLKTVDDELTFPEELGQAQKPETVKHEPMLAQTAPHVETVKAAESPKDMSKVEAKPVASLPQNTPKAVAEKKIPNSPVQIKSKETPQKIAKKETVVAQDPKEDTRIYTLQLSSFQDKVEAELFMERLRKQGLKPNMVVAQIPNRGVWYRVRLGKYKGWEQAAAAKRAFESTEKETAYVALQQ
ncbi:MAG: SPOR domain-containing protein [Pseudomonadota bacterium]